MRLVHRLILALAVAAASAALAACGGSAGGASGDSSKLTLVAYSTPKEAYGQIIPAFDKTAQSGSGIDRVQIFLDSRDLGGVFLTGAMPGTNNMWHAIVSLPTNQTGLHTLYFYAHSAATGQEAVVSIPVTIAP